MDIKVLNEAHEYCSDNKKYLVDHTKCGCFYCMQIFDSNEVKEFLNETSETALCPYCEIDSVLPERDGLAITKDFLEEMHEYWFATKSKKKFIKWFLEKKKNTKTMEIIRKISRIPNKGKFKVNEYFYAFMLELKDGGISLASAGEKDFFSKNWRMMRSNYKNIILKIYDLFLNDINEFHILLIELGANINSPEFMKWVTIPWFRFLTIKSLHDSSITLIRFDEIKQELTLFLETKFAIDYIPFNNEVEMMFKTRNFHPQNFEDLVKCVDSNASIIFDVNTYFDRDELNVEVDYECFNNTKTDYVLPDLKFICENVLINNFLVKE